MLIVGTTLVFTQWNENYGDSSLDIIGTFSNALTAIRNGNFSIIFLINFSKKLKKVLKKILKIILINTHKNFK